MGIENLSIPYDDFKLNEIIDPEQFDLNNLVVKDKVNEILAVLNQITDSVENGNSGADIISLSSIEGFASNKLQAFLEEVITQLRSTENGNSGANFIASTTISGVTGENVQEQLESLKSLLDSLNSELTSRINQVEQDAVERDEEIDSNSRQRDEEIDSNSRQRDNNLQNQISTNENNIANLEDNLEHHHHDSRYMTRDQLAPYLQGGDTLIHYDVFTIVSSNNGDGTFTYRNTDGEEFIGELNDEGLPIFQLTNTYGLGMNRISADIDDTLHRSVASGGLIEIDPNHIMLGDTYASGTEITFKYYERIGITGEHSVVIGEVEPPPSYGSTLWFKVVE